MRMWWAILVALAAMPLRAEPVTVTAEGLTVGLDPAAGYAVTSLKRADGFDFLAGPAGAKLDRPLWQLLLRDARGTTTLRPADGTARHEVRDGGLAIVWTSVGKAAGADLTVTATIRPRGGDLLWRIAVTGTAPAVLWQVDFPRVEGLQPLGDERLAYPEYWGRLVRQPTTQRWTRTLIYPQPASMQWLAYWGGQHPGTPAPPATGAPFSELGWSSDGAADRGLYWAAEDGRGYTKRFGVRCGLPGGDGNGLGWWVEQVPELAVWPPAPGVQPINYTQPYDVVTASFTGDQFAAAAKYRAWAAKQVWCSRGTADRWPTERPDDGSEALVRWVPEWFRELGFWAKFYQEPAQVVPQWAAFAKWLRVPMASHWYRYTVARFDDNYPEMLPADPYFLQGLRDGRAMNVRALPYTNGSIWDEDTQSWLQEDGRACALKNEAGNPYLWDIDHQLYAYGCPATPQWQAKLREWSDKLVAEHGCSGEYLDVLVATQAQPCYDPAHGHPLHGGAWYGAGNRRLLYDLRRHTRERVPDAAFFSEEIGELYCDLLDGHLTLDQQRAVPPPGGQVYPLFTTVYHPYTINFGGDAELGGQPDVYALLVGQGLIWGSQPLNPGVSGSMPKPGDANSEFLRDAVQNYETAGLPFLLGGELLPLVTRPTGTPTGGAALELAAAPHRIDVPVQRGRDRTWSGPAVLASAWRRGEQVGLVLVNLTGTAQPVELTVGAAKLGLAGARLRRTWPDAADLGAADGAHALTVPARRTLFLVLAAGEPLRGRPLLDTPWELLTAEGPFPAATGPRGALFACADGPVRNRVGATTEAQPVRMADDGTFTPRAGHQAKPNGAAAEGHGLPRAAAEQPFLLLQRLPHTASGGEVLVWSGDDSSLSALAPGGTTLKLGRPGYVIARDTVTGKRVRTLSDPVTDTVTLPAGGPYLVGYAALDALRANLALPGGVVQLAELLGPLRGLTSGAPSIRELALAAASRTLDQLERHLDDQLGELLPQRPLGALHRAIQALVGAQVGWRPSLRAEHDWLAPGIPKELTLAAWRPGDATPPAALDISPLGPWPKTSLPAAAPRNPANLFTALPLRHRFEVGNVVERLAPVLGGAAVEVDGRLYRLSDILLLEANRPVEIRASSVPTVAVAGRPAKVTFTLRNASPYAVPMQVAASGPAGWTITPATPPAAVPVAPLADATATVTLAAPAGTARGRYEVLATAGYGKGTQVVAVLPIEVRRGLRPLDPAAPAPVKDEAPARLRNVGSVALYAAQGEPIHAVIRNIRVTIYSNTLKYTLFDPDMQPVRTGQVKVDETTTLDLPAPKTGGYVLRLEPGSGSAEVTIANRFHGEVSSAEEPLHLFCSPITRYFYVPAGAKAFRLGYRDGGPDEVATFKVISPTGREALSFGGRGAGQERPVEVRPEEAGQVWTLRVEPVQDMEMWLAGDVAPYLSKAKARVLAEEGG